MGWKFERGSPTFGGHVSRYEVTEICDRYKHIALHPLPSYWLPCSLLCGAKNVRCGCMRRNLHDNFLIKGNMLWRCVDARTHLNMVTGQAEGVRNNDFKVWFVQIINWRGHKHCNAIMHNCHLTWWIIQSVDIGINIKPRRIEILLWVGCFIWARPKPRPIRISPKNNSNTHNACYGMRQNDD